MDGLSEEDAEKNHADDSTAFLASPLRNVSTDVGINGHRLCVEVTTTRLKGGSESSANSEDGQEWHSSSSAAGKSSKGKGKKEGLFSSLKGWSRRDKIMIATMAVSEGVGFAMLSMIAPLFPPLASERGMSKTASGLVFSCFAFVAFLTAPIFGVLTHKYGVKVLEVGGLVVSCFACVAFGLMENVTNPTWFAVGCFTLRILLGIAYSAFITAIFATVTTLYQSKMGLVLSLLEIVIGLGLSIGPPLASALFSVGGYELPFVVMGVVMFGTAIPSFFVIPSNQEYFKREHEMDEEGKKEEKRPIRMIFFSWEPMLFLITITTLGIAFVYFHPVLQPFLEHHFGTTETEAGFVFLAILGSYCLTTPISGILSDARPQYKYQQMIVGTVIASIGCQIMGPAPYLQSIIPISIVTTVIGLMITGLGFALAVIPTFHGFLTATIESGFPSTVRTFGLTSSFWNAAWSLGETIGPTISSTVADETGDEIMSFLTASFILLLLAVLLTAHLIFCKSKSKASESQGSGDIVSGNGEASIVKTLQTSAQAHSTKVEDLVLEIEGTEDTSGAVTSPSAGESDAESTGTPMYSAVSSPSHLLKDDCGNQPSENSEDQTRHEVQATVRL